MRLSAALAVTAIVVAVVPAGADARILLERVGTFAEPVYVTAPPGDRERVFVVERRGRVRILRRGRRLRRPFLDVSGLVVIRNPQPEQDHRGLVSLAFDPRYARTRRLYISYTDASDNLRIEELRASRRNPDRVDPRSRRTVLSMPLEGSYDFGGHIAFGPDRLLYVGIGYGFSPTRGHGQDLTTLAGKLLRIDPRPAGSAPYRIPAGNPFASRAGGARPEIYSYGLRNPWRFSFDRRTVGLAIGDVGHREVEEIDFMRVDRAAGANFGWELFEGTRQRLPGTAPGHVPPVLEHLHRNGWCAVIGGHVIRDRSLRGLRGRYIYGNLCSGEIRSARLSDAGATGDRREPVKVDGGYLVSFGEDGRGRTYAVRLAGEVYRLRIR